MVWFNFMTDITRTFWGDYGYATLFAIALVAIIILEKEKLRGHIILWYTGLTLVFIYNPLTLFVCKQFMEQSTFDQYYQRFYSLIPVVAVIAYGLVLVISRFTGAKKLIATLAALVIIVAAGNLIYTQDWFTKAENRLKVPQDVVTIDDLFAEDTSDRIRIMAPQDIAVYLRQVDSRFSMPYARFLPDEAYELTNEHPDCDIVMEYATSHDVDYVVVSAVEDILNAYLNYGFKLYGRTTYYAVLEVSKPTWLVTEYATASGDQCNCYTVVNKSDGTLIVIDGGDAANEATVREAIKENGNHVTAWIITHYHQDHVDAFNAIYADLQGITIDDIYVTPLDSDTFHTVAKEWDDVDSYDTFMSLTADADNIHHVARDDKLVFDNMTITFFNAFDGVVAASTEDIPNDDSLVFKLDTGDRSMLVCGDCHTSYMADYLVKTYGKKLSADILQCGHHGNNSMPTDSGFYEAVSPQVAIFDCPDWVMTSPEYTAGALAGYLKEAGIRICYFATAPNVFGL